LAVFLATSLDHLGPDVLHGVRQIDLLGDGRAVARDQWWAEALVEHDVSSTRAQGSFHSAGKLPHAAPDHLSALVSICNRLWRHVVLPALRSSPAVAAISRSTAGEKKADAAKHP
jgi:hypothetical protein